MDSTAMRQILLNPITLGVFTIGIAVGIYSLNHTTREIQDSAATIHGLDQEINQTKSEIDKLHQELSRAGTPLAQEVIIRDELLMQKPGEIVVQLPELPASPPPDTMLATELLPWQQWLALVAW